MILQHENATPHRSSVACQTINGLQWELLPHPAYSPDIAPTDFHLFHLLQNILAEHHFKTKDEVRKVRKVIDEFIASKNKAFWRRGIRQLPERWQSVVEDSGDYIGWGLCEDWFVFHLIFINNKRFAKTGRTFLYT